MCTVVMPTPMTQTPVVLQADEDLAQCILKAGVLPYFALSWYITWFAHEVQSLPQIARLFDLFMASHPLMPLYAGAAAMKVRVCRACACDGMLPIIRR
jgi:TBC1 domain family member 20